MHAAVISAINEVKTEGAVTNGYLRAGSVAYTVNTFSDALAAWTDGTTLTMLGDATLLTEIETTAQGLVLDLNGCTLASTDAQTISVQGASELTIRDSKDAAISKDL